MTVEGAILLDVNVMVALFWPAHEFHTPVRKWFSKHGSRNWASCPLTQNGFVRIISNPAFSRDALSVDDALRLLMANTQLPGHAFWPDDIDIRKALSVSGARLQGYRQLTDAYLLGLAIHRNGRLATLDGSVASLPRHGGHPVNAVIDLSTSIRSG